MVKSIDWIQFLAPQPSSGTPVLGIRHLLLASISIRYISGAQTYLRKIGRKEKSKQASKLA